MPRNTARDNFTLALEATENLLQQELKQIFADGSKVGLGAHAEIQVAPLTHKTLPFLLNFVPLRKRLVLVLASGYRRYSKLAFAHPRRTGSEPHEWASGQLLDFVNFIQEWICEWYVLACDGENQWVRRTTSAEGVPGQIVSPPIPNTIRRSSSLQSWRAPAWLFQVSPLFGIEPIKKELIPATDSEEKLGAEHTKLLLEGARRVFLWDLEAAIKMARNEEVAAAGTIPEHSVNKEVRRINRKGRDQREKLHNAIRKILRKNPDLEGIGFCAELDKHHALPLYDWTERGEWQSHFTWKQAWSVPSLRDKIRRVRQEAMRNR
jgi:hypothetical protein